MHYEFDHTNFKFKKSGISIWKPVRQFLIYLLATVSVTVVLYFVLSLFISTDVEKKLSRENRMYEKLYPTLEEKEDFLGDVITGLQVKDNDLYEQIFHTESPGVDPAASLDFLFGSDTIPDSKLVRYTQEKADKLLEKGSSVEENFRRAFELLAQGEAIPPMEMPLEGLSYSQIGASTGMKISPFLKAYVLHDGLDLIAPQETPVLSAGSGIVINVTRSTKGSGNTVVIEHEGGYVTRYSHLSATSVKQGNHVNRGQKIGTVGMTGTSFAPHLHYEVLKDGMNMDPMGYILASVSADEYGNMLYMAASTKQSMD